MGVIVTREQLIKAGIRSDDIDFFIRQGDIPAEAPFGWFAQEIIDGFYKKGMSFIQQYGFSPKNLGDGSTDTRTADEKAAARRKKQKIVAAAEELAKARKSLAAAEEQGHLTRNHRDVNEFLIRSKLVKRLEQQLRAAEAEGGAP